MADITLNVTMNDGHLNVDQANGKNRIPHGDYNVILNLSGNAASGQFNAITGAHPGFNWIGNNQPPHNVFGAPTLQNGGKQIRISDNNQHSGGPWIYQIYATIDGHEYSTTTSVASVRQVINNPTIQNM